MKLIDKKLVNFMNFIFCVFKVLQCREKLLVTHKCKSYILLKMDISEENKQEKQWKISLSHQEKLLVTREKLLVTQD